MIKIFKKVNIDKDSFVESAHVTRGKMMSEIVTWFNLWDCYFVLWTNMLVKVMVRNTLFLNSVPRCCAMTISGGLCRDWFNTPLHEFDCVNEIQEIFGMHDFMMCWGIMFSDVVS